MKKIVMFIGLGIFLLAGVLAFANPFNIYSREEGYEEYRFENFAAIEKFYNERNNKDKAIIINEKIITNNEFNKKKNL